MNATPPRPSTGALAGIALGMSGWVVGVAIVAVVGGRADLLVALALPALLASLALAAMLAVAHAAVVGLCGARSTAARCTLAGGALACAGVLLLLAAHQVMPVLAADPRLVEVLRATHAATAVPTWLPPALLAPAVVLLGSAWRSAARTPA